MSETGNSPMRSVHRAFSVLKALELAQQPVRLTDLARRTGFHLATTQRLVNVLVEHGYASRNSHGYTAGPAALSTAHAFATTSPLRLVARPVLEQLASATGLTASLYVRIQDNRVLVDRHEGGSRPEYSLPIGERLPLYPGAAGKVFLAVEDIDVAVEKATAGSPTVRLANGTVFDHAEVRHDLTRAREQGFAVSVDERQLGTTAVAALIIDVADRPLGSLGLSGATSAMLDIHASSLPAEVRRAAETIGARVPSAV